MVLPGINTLVKLKCSSVVMVPSNKVMTWEMRIEATWVRDSEEEVLAVGVPAGEVCDDEANVDGCDIDSVECIGRFEIRKLDRGGERKEVSSPTDKIFGAISEILRSQQARNVLSYSETSLESQVIAIAQVFTPILRKLRYS